MASQSSLTEAGILFVFLSTLDDQSIMSNCDRDIVGVGVSVYFRWPVDYV